MKRILFISLFTLTSFINAQTLCPDGSYVGGDDSELAPDGTYTGR